MTPDRDRATLNLQADDPPAEGADRARLAEVLDAYLTARERGEAVSPEALLAEHAEDADALRGYLSALRLFEGAAASPTLGGAPHGGPIGPGSVVGDYRLECEVGRGGMGVVFRATQLSLGRAVALKVLPLAASRDPRHIARFRAEAQSAAMVRHPHIVPVYTVGEEHGVHYFAMQLIEGRSLARWLEEEEAHPVDHEGSTLAAGGVSTVGPGKADPTPAPHRGGGLTGAARVRQVALWGVQAAEALHSAHTHGVVHRDVKPSNLLVDGDGKLWVTDFGLARVRDAAGVTQTGAILGTVRYMSPEQALGGGEPIDHRTDVYSLGVTLYELAARRHPAQHATDRQLVLDPAARRCRPLRHLDRRTPVDFETIVMKALAESPADRYQTARALAEDLRRFLEGRPILASRPGLVTRLGKLAYRRRRVVAAAAVVAALGFAGLAVGMVALAGKNAQLARANAGLEAANLALHQSNAQKQQALGTATRRLTEARSAVDRFTVTADQLVDLPSGEGLRRRLLEDGVAFYQRLLTEAADDPALKTDLAMAHCRMGSLLERLGEADRAQAAYASAVAQLEPLAGRGDAEADAAMAVCLGNLGLLRAQRGETAAGLASLARAASIGRKHASRGAREQLDLATTYVNLGVVLRQAGRPVPAAARLREAVALLKPLCVEPSPERSEARERLVAACNNLAALDGAGRPGRAAKPLARAAAAQLELAREAPLDRGRQALLAQTYNNLGFALAESGRQKEAEERYNDAIAVQRRLTTAAPLVAHYRRDLAVSLNNRGRVLAQTGRRDQAEASFRESLRLLDGILDEHPDDPRTLSHAGGVCNNLAELAAARGDTAGAEEWYEDALARQRRAVAAAPGRTAAPDALSNHAYNYAAWLRRQGRHAEALALSRERLGLVQGDSEGLYSVAVEVASAPRGSEPDHRALASEALRKALAAGLDARRIDLPGLASASHGAPAATPREPAPRGVARSEPAPRRPVN